MSRIRLLNIPKEINEASLKDHIMKNLPADAPPVTITDAFIKRTNTGKIRMAFLGFKTSAAGEYVMKRFNGTYLGPLKLAIDAAVAVGVDVSKGKIVERIPKASDAPVEPRPASRDSESPSRDVTSKSKKRKELERDGGEELDEKAKRKEEFVAKRLQQQGTSSSWANEVLAPEIPVEVAQDDDDSDDDDEAKPAADLNAVSDMDFLAMLNTDEPKPVSEEDAKNEVDDLDEPVGVETNEVPSVELTSEELARKNKRVRAYNIPFAASESEVKNFFSSSFGPVEEVVVPLTKDTKQSKGVAFVQFVNAEDAVRAATQGNMAVFMGRLVRMEGCEPPRKRTDDDEGAQGTGVDASGAKLSSYKAEKAAEVKKTDGVLKWNSLYMQSHAAVSTMAQRLNVDRKDIVSVENKGAAVRAAVAEAILTSEAKNVLGDESINFDKINGETQASDARSNTTILVKNLLPTTNMTDLAKNFRRFGQIENLAVPSGSAFALFGFAHAQDARIAFQRLAYKKFGGTVLFLEWAPLGAIVEGEEDTIEQKETPAVEDAQTSQSVYITNLPFNTTEDALKIYLADTAPRLVGKLEKLIKRINIVADKGRAYLDAADGETASYLISKLNGKSYEGRTIAAVQAKSTKKPTTASEVPPGCDPLKVIVKNLPFEATEADLRELFKSFSEVKAVRVPKKVHAFSSHRENNHRGFGFVEFLTEEEAARAIRSLSNTHLYGRHLVLQFAKMHDS